MAKDEKNFLEMFQESLEYEEGWRRVAEDDFLYYTGNQWTDADRQKLKKQKRPVLVINRLKAQVDALVGHQRQNRYDIKFMAEQVKEQQESEENKAIVDDLNREIMDIMSDEGGLGHQTLSLAFKSGVQCGRGFIECSLDDSEDMADPRIVVEKLNSLHVLLDPALTKYDVNKGSHIIKSIMTSKESLMFKFQDFAKEIKKMSGAARIDPHETDSERQRFDEMHLAEVWHKEVVTERILIDPILEKVQPLEGNKQEREEIVFKYVTNNLELFREASGVAVADQAFIARVSRAISVKNRNTHEIRSAILINGHLFRDEVPYKRLKMFPIIGYFPSWMEEAKFNSDRYQGIIRQLKDPQNEINKRHSAGLHILGTQSNSGWVVDEASTSAGERKKIANFGSKPGIVIVWDSRKGVKPERISAMPAHQGNLIYEDKAGDNMHKISGLNPESLVMGDKNDSGKALALKIQQASILIQEYFDNLLRTTRLEGELIVQLIEEKNDVDYPNRRIVVAESPHNVTMQLVKQQEMSEFVSVYGQFIPPEILGPIVIEQSSLNDDVKKKMIDSFGQVAEAQIQ